MRGLAFLFLAGAVCLLTTDRGVASGPREFAATWTLGPAAENGDEIVTTLSLRLLNESAISLSAAGLTVAETAGAEHTGLFPPFDLPAGESISLSAEVRVSAREFRHWQSGAQPIVILDFSLDGAVMREPVEMTPAISSLIR